ncbi:MAG: molybdopterin-binding protein [Thaumarchaeota archaeon]|nr:molybdopterin-binding protein [Candidatus Calditenuaceae archaeon]MDW8186639.1 molybdopterin-binding protein [Nitrososphaerota archaeon]
MGRGKSSSVEIIVVGNEVLNGEVLDTNSNWLAKRLYASGLHVRRITLVRDDLREIATAIREALRRGTEWVVTTGGLGPTDDDMTLQGVSFATRRKLTLNSEGLEMLRERYAKLYEMGVVRERELTPARLKMAMLPRGAKALRNRVGSAPGSLLKHGRSWIVSLPGVPSEMKDIYENEVEPLILRNAKRVYRYVGGLVVRGVPESTLAPLLSSVSKKSKLVYIKSHPKGIEAGRSVVEVIVHGEGSSEGEVEKLVESVLRELHDRVKRLMPDSIERIEVKSGS